MEVFRLNLFCIEIPKHEKVLQSKMVVKKKYLIKIASCKWPQIWIAIFPFVWQSKYFLMCQFPSLACHLALGTPLFRTLCFYFTLFLRWESEPVCQLCHADKAQQGRNSCPQLLTFRLTFFKGFSTGLVPLTCEAIVPYLVAVSVVIPCLVQHSYIVIN